ncbi:hypothetical protein BOX15_Mlig018795g4, partial [Macrostomum lignano]
MTQMVHSKAKALEILKLDPNALLTPADIKAAYKNQAIQLHPERLNQSELEIVASKFRLLTLAFKKLTGTEQEVKDLDEKFKDPMFMWYLFSALFDEDVPSDSDTSDDDDYDYHRPWQLNGHGAASQSSESNDHRSPTYHNREKVIRTAEEAEKNANELIEAEEQRKEQLLKRDEKK